MKQFAYNRLSRTQKEECKMLTLDWNITLLLNKFIMTIQLSFKLHKPSKNHLKEYLLLNKTLFLSKDLLSLNCQSLRIYPNQLKYHPKFRFQQLKE
jgi:hypothetical protein